MSNNRIHLKTTTVFIQTTTVFIQTTTVFIQTTTVFIQKTSSFDKDFIIMDATYTEKQCRSTHIYTVKPV